MNTFMKKAAAIAVATALTTGAMPQVGIDKPLLRSDVLLADAADNVEWLTYDTTTKTITITDTPKALDSNDIIYSNGRVAYTANQALNIKINSGVVLPENCEGLFSAYTNVESIDLSDADTGNVVNMSKMFSDHERLKTVDLSSWDVRKTTNMNYMFSGCSSLKTITGLSYLVTSNLKTAKYMFSNCSSLQELDLKEFDTGKVTDAQGMFSGCSSLSKLTLGENIKKIETSYSLPNGNGWANEKDKTTVVSGSGSFAEITNSGTNTYSKSEELPYEFNESTGLLTLKGEILVGTLADVPKDKVKKVIAEEGTKIAGAKFRDYTNCTEIDLSKSVLTSITALSLYMMFYNCSSLEKLNVSGWDTSKVQDMGGMFDSCFSLKELDLSSFSTASLSNQLNEPPLKQMFSRCDSLTKLTLGSNFTSLPKEANLPKGELGWSKSTAPETIVSGTGDYAVITNSGKTTYLKDYALTPTTDCYSFNGTTGLLTLKKVVDRDTIKNLAEKESVKSITAESGTIFKDDVSGMFAGYKNCTDIDLSNVDTSRATKMSEMFRGCRAVKDINLTSWDTKKVTSMYMMFYDCAVLENLDVSSLNTSNVTDMGYMFAYDYELKSLDLSTFNTANVTSMQYMFTYNYKLTELDLSKFNTAKVTTMESMFDHCTGLKSLKINKFDTSNCKNFKAMLSNCSALPELVLLNFNTSNAETMDDFFKDCNSLADLALGDKFGDVTEGMKLPQGDGWVDSNDTKKVISGSGSYAVISNPNMGLYFKLTKIAAEKYDLTGLGFPAPGTKVKDSLADLKPVSDMYTIDKEHTGWVDAKTGEMLDSDDIFQFGGAYFLAVRLVPKNYYFFAEPTELSLVQSKLYASDGTTEFCDGYRYSGIVNEDGSLEFAAELSNYRGTNFVGYEYPDGRKACAFPLLGVKINPLDAHTIHAKTMYNGTYQEPTGAPDYYYSIDKEKWYSFAELNGIGIQKLKSDTEYTVYVKTKDMTEAFYSTKVKTPASEEAEPIYKVDITDVVVPNALELPAKTAKVSGDGALLCVDSGIAEYGTAGISWTDDESGKAMPADTKFLAGKKYTINVLVSAKEGYAFPAELTDITATVNGKEAAVKSVADGKYIQISYQFTATGTNKVTVKFDPCGGIGTMADESVTAFTEYALPECGFTAPAGKVFAGWKSGEKVYAAGDTVTFDGDATVEAVWETIKYTITFAANGGKGEMTPVKADINSEAVLPECKFTFNNKRFTGWFINGETKHAGDKVTVTKDMTFYAMWEFNNVTVKLEANGAEGSMPDTVMLLGSTFTFPKCTFTAPEGKEFGGWQVGEKTYEAGDAIIINANTSVKALWSEPSAKTVLVGDVNSDGTVDSVDAILLAHYAASWPDVVINLKASDLNGDEVIDNADALILARYVAGWEGYDSYIVTKTV
jgi:surface protein